MPRDSRHPLINLTRPTSWLKKHKLFVFLAARGLWAACKNPSSRSATTRSSFTLPAELSTLTRFPSIAEREWPKESSWTTCKWDVSFIQNDAKPVWSEFYLWKRHWYFGGNGPWNSQLTPLLEPGDADFKNQSFLTESLRSCSTKERPWLLERLWKTSDSLRASLLGSMHSYHHPLTGMFKI